MLSIKQQQYNLKYCGYYYTGSIDGIKGPKHNAAIKAFQKAKGLTVDGIWGAKTDAASIADVKQLQRNLHAVGFYLTIDGLVGANTIVQIKAFQKSASLSADGIAGTNTNAKLKAEVKDLQTKLNKFGYGLTVDGIVGTATDKAIRAFQKSKGLTVDGCAGANTDKALGGGLSWSDIKYFKRSEFKCPCGKCNGYPAEPDLKMVQLMDKIRAAYGKPITITSGVRCKDYNKKVGGISTSEHLNGKAADFYIPGQNDTAADRRAVVSKAYSLGAKYSYANTAGMGNAVHVNI